MQILMRYVWKYVREKGAIPVEKGEQPIRLGRWCDDYSNATLHQVLFKNRRVLDGGDIRGAAWVDPSLRDVIFDFTEELVCVSDQPVPKRSEVEILKQTARSERLSKSQHPHVVVVPPANQEGFERGTILTSKDKSRTVLVVEQNKFTLIEADQVWTTVT